MTAAIPEIRERLEAEFARRSAAGGENSANGGGGMIPLSGDRADRAQAENSARLGASLASRTIRERMAIRQAIDRIDAGCYGLCLGCGAEIAAGRLDAIPWAALCVDCQQEWEALEIA
ncbi:MAG: TraR/DksA family transcriptional regulator [Bryobacterales bacterium]|nr:TraR/DksA family transcriptional regulator [Bryobacterales bacterium]MDE0294636.1 TraR/DksA family transcriptional regulator [Bryobacterales bacterium]